MAAIHRHRDRLRFRYGRRLGFQQSAFQSGPHLQRPSRSLRSPPFTGSLLERGLPETDARSLTFVSLVLVDLGLVLVNRSFATSLVELIGKANRALMWVALVTVALLALVLVAPFARALFRFGPLHADDLTLVVVIVVAVFAALEFLKRLWRGRLVA